MDLENLLNLFEEIFDLCLSLENHNITEAIDPLYMDAQNAKNKLSLLDIVDEMLNIVDEYSDQDRQTKVIRREIQEIYNKFLDEIE
jgi:hypothetical protein